MILKRIDSKTERELLSSQGYDKLNHQSEGFKIAVDENGEHWIRGQMLSPTSEFKWVLVNKFSKPDEFLYDSEIELIDNN